MESAEEFSKAYFAHAGSDDGCDMSEETCLAQRIQGRDEQVRREALEVIQDLLNNETCSCRKDLERVYPCPRCKLTLDEARTLVERKP